ncbi:hypothetical protein AZE42_07008, partial [Rhizopogon vesiculosus]
MLWLASLQQAHRTQEQNGTWCLLRCIMHDSERLRGSRTIDTFIHARNDPAAFLLILTPYISKSLPSEWSIVYLDYGRT